MDKIWYNDPSVLIDRPTEIFPIKYKNMDTKERKINSVVRLAGYALIAIFIFYRKCIFTAIMMTIMLLIVTFLYYESKCNGNDDIQQYIPISQEEMNDEYVMPDEGFRQYSKSNSGSNIEDILDHIKGTSRVFSKFVEPNKEYQYFNNHLHRDKTKYKQFTKNKTNNGRQYGAQQHEVHLKKLKEIYNVPRKI